MKLEEFLLNKTQTLELCVIRDSGWIVASCYIDHEDLFDSHLSHGLRDMKVKGDEWGAINITLKKGDVIQIPCHYVDV
jgi:hypothetical protein